MKTLLSRRPREHGFFLATLLIATCTFISFLSWRSENLYDFLATSGQKVFFESDWASLFTAIFVHADLGHLLSNSYMLFLLSLFTLGTLTPNLAKGLQLLAGFFTLGAAVNYLTLQAYEAQVRLVGISGLVYAFAGFWLYNYLRIDTRRPLRARVLRALGTGLVILFPTTFDKSTSYTAHFYGLIAGILFGSLFFSWNRQWIKSFEETRVEALETFEASDLPAELPPD